MAFTGLRLDRADHVRADPSRLADMRARTDARVLVLDGLAPPITGDRLDWIEAASLPEDSELVFLGLDEGAPVFAQLGGEGDKRPAYRQRMDWTGLNRLSADELAIYGGARSLVDWHARHRFCAQCGEPTAIAKGGWQRDCPSCKAEHFPRTDPVAIMLVEHDGDLLLARGTRFPERYFSTLAGFIEPGETIEQAVAREVLEEVGVVVDDVNYVTNQPWPFPSQLMIGCCARATGKDLKLDPVEIAEARWFTRDELTEAMDTTDDARDYKVPPGTAISHHLMRWWLENGDI